MQKSAMVIINPTSGQENASSYDQEIQDSLKEDYPNLKVKYTEKTGDATKFAKEASENEYNLIVSVGGDGTVNETVNGMAPYDTPPTLAIIPMGTVNNLARTLKIPMDTSKAIALLQDGSEKSIDVGLVNNQYFTNVLGIGQAAQAVHDVDIEEKSKWGPLAYVKAVSAKILEEDSFEVKFKMDQENFNGQASVILVALIDSLGGLQSIIPEAELGDGMLHVLVIKSVEVSKLLNMTPALAFDEIENSENIEYYRTKRLKVEIRSGNYPSTIDGDEGPNPPLDISVNQKHIKIIANDK